MRRMSGISVSIVLVLGVSTGVWAEICAFDAGPAATLLFPYVVLDYNDPFTGLTTILTITNVVPSAQIVRVTLWTDLHEPILDFNIVLSGYDQQAINIRDVLVYGQLPVTGTAAGLVVDGGVPSPMGPVSPQSPLADAGGTGTLVNRCSPSSPYYPGNYVTPIPANILALLQNWLQTSQTDPRTHSDCAGSYYPIGDWFETRTTAGPTWMYVTADVVESCGAVFPTDPSYWTDHVRYDNALIGAVAWVDMNAGTADLANAVHLEADPGLANWSELDPTGAPASFYYRQSTHQGAPSDLREPLPTSWAVHYYASAPLSTRIRAWKAPSWLNDLETVNIGGVDHLAAWDCRAYTYYAWDESENVVVGAGDPFNHFPLGTQEVSVDELMVPDTEGWILFQWPRDNTLYDMTHDFYQTWMGASTVITGTMVMGADAIPMGNSNCRNVMQQLVHWSSFEYGDLRGWHAMP